VKCEGQNLSHFTQDCGDLTITTNQENATTATKQEKATTTTTTTTTTTKQEKATTSVDEAELKFRPGIVSPIYDENESKLYKIL
jgi:hypothetical protein